MSNLDVTASQIESEVNAILQDKHVARGECLNNIYYSPIDFVSLVLGEQQTRRQWEDIKDEYAKRQSLNFLAYSYFSNVRLTTWYGRTAHMEACRKELLVGIYRHLIYPFLGIPLSQDGRITYFIQAENNGLIKIGSTIDVEKRLRQIRYMSPVGLELIAITNYYELSLHDRFSHHRHHGEWFFPAPIILRFIREYGLDPKTNEPRRN